MKEKIKYKAIHNDDLIINETNQSHDFSEIERINGCLTIDAKCTKAINFKSLKYIDASLKILNCNQSYKFPILDHVGGDVSLAKVVKKITFPALKVINWSLSIRNASEVVYFPVLDIVKFTMTLNTITVAPRFPKLRVILRGFYITSVSADVKFESLEEIYKLEVVETTSNIKLNKLVDISSIEVTGCEKSLSIYIPKVTFINTLTLSKHCCSLHFNTIKHIHSLNLESTVNPHSFNGLELVDYLDLTNTRATHSFRKLNKIGRNLCLRFCRSPQNFAALQYVLGTLDLRDNKALHVFKNLEQTGDIDLARNIAPFNFKTLKKSGVITLKRTAKEYKFNALVESDGINIDKYTNDIKFPVLTAIGNAGINIAEFYNNVEFPALVSAIRITLGANISKTIEFPVLKYISRILQLTRCNVQFGFPVLEYIGEINLTGVKDYDFSSLTRLGCIQMENSRNIKFDNKELKLISHTSIRHSNDISIKHVAIQKQSLDIRNSINVAIPSLKVVQDLELFSNINVDISNLCIVNNTVDIKHILSHLDLSKLKYIKNHLDIYDCDYTLDESITKTNELCHVKLNSLEYVLGHVNIQDCKSIIDIPKLKLIGKSCILKSLTSTPLLESVKHIDGDIKLVDIHYQSLLNNLEYVAGSYEINKALLDPDVVTRIYNNMKSNYNELAASAFYVNGDNIRKVISNKYLDIYIKLGYLCVDGICAKIKSKKGNMYKCVTDDLEQTTVYIASIGSYWAHGETLRKANNDVQFKLNNDRGKDVYKDLKLTSKKTLDDWMVCYRIITGACSYGVGRFVDEKVSKADRDNEAKLFTLKTVLDITVNQYGHECFVIFFQDAIHAYNESKKKPNVA